MMLRDRYSTANMTRASSRYCHAVELLNTGYDAPSVRCLIDAFPTKSLSSYVQRIGRVLRLHKDKPHAIILDHAGNVAKHGFAEDVVPDALHDGEKEYRERDQTKEKKEPKTMDCPRCLPDHDHAAMCMWLRGAQG